MTARAERPSDADQWKDIARQLYIALAHRECRCRRYSAEGIVGQAKMRVMHQCMRCAAMDRYEIEGAQIPNSNG